jgi:CheY-like chemotaxis protein/HPt (histidine-containing phosphotransfer) domain-containing protein
MKFLPSALPGRLSFRQQLLLTVSLGIICLALASSFVISSLSNQTVRARLIDQSRHVTESFARQSTLALLYQSSENALDAAKTTLQFPDVDGVAIYDGDQRPLLSHGEDPLPPEGHRYLPETPRLAHETEEAWYFVAPVYSQAADVSDSPFVMDPPQRELLGLVRTVVSKETLRQMGADILRSNLIISTTFAGLLLLVLFTLTARLTKPLKNLADAMRRANLSKRPVQLNLTGPKDIIEMETAFNTMADILRAREDELASARDAALESARIKGEFAANVSHELRTPLNGVLGMLELLHGEELAPHQREYVEVARKSGESLLELIGNVLDFSRIGSGKLELEIIDFDLLEVLDDVVNQLARQAQQKALDLQYLVPWDAPAMFRGDPGRLRQVLINLTSNALKFTKHGGVAIEIRELETTTEQRVLRFEVQDTGIGVSLEAQERIFEAFSQADGSTTRQYGGTGLGLSISRQLVRLMGGDMGIESELGNGSTFWFTAKLEQTSEPPAIPRIDLEGLKELRVLIVDDSIIVRRCLEQTLERWAIAHTSIAESWRALGLLRDTVRAKPFDVVLIDEAMSGLSGHDFVRQVSGVAKIADVRVVMMTHNVGQRPAQPAGVAGWLIKPIRVPVLRDCLAGCNGRERRAISVLPSSQHPRFADGRRILLVEDNRSNQQVALAMLAKLGGQAEVAATGREALQAVTQETYDLILMDCQMPEMDGYEATEKIRALETYSRHVPIVAMTAHAQEGNVDRCRTAGMDDYLSKPLRLEALRNTLERWLPHAPHETNPSHNDAISPSAPVQSDAPLDPTLFRELQETAGDTTATVIELFLEDTPKYIKDITDAISAHNVATVARSAHAIKGSASNLGATALANTCKRLEHAQTTEDAQALVASLHREYRRVASALWGELRMASAPKAATQGNDPPRILIVDDDRTIRLPLRKVLLRDGYQVQEAADGIQAVALCKRQMPDLLLMDGMMPGLDGFDACRQIRQLPLGQHVPVLILSALEDDDAVDRAFSSGATDYVRKPLHFTAIRQRVAQLLDTSQTEPARTGSGNILPSQA